MPVLAACAGQAPLSASDTALVPTQTNLQNCREFTTRVAVEGQTLQAVGQTCLQPDGSWQVTLNTPGLPQQVYTLPPPAMSQVSYPEPYYYGWNPWFYGSWFVDGPVFVANGVRHFHHHHFKQQSGSHHGGYHGGRK